MKISATTVAAIGLLALALYTVAGNLEPPGPPDTGTMRTLDEIYAAAAASQQASVCQLTGEYTLSGAKYAAESRELIAMTIPEYPGPGTGEGREDTSLILDVEQIIAQPFDPLTGSAVRDRQHGPLSVIKQIDKATPGLHKALCTGQNLSEVVLDYYRIDPDTRLEEVYYRITLRNARVVEIGPTTNYVSAEGYKHMEKVSFVYEEIEWNWLPDSIVEMDRWAASGS